MRLSFPNFETHITQPVPGAAREKPKLFQAQHHRLYGDEVVMGDPAYLR